MTHLIVLFNLKDGVERSEYETWARSTDLPIVRGLDSINSFSIYRASELLGSDEKPPFQYVEVIQIDDMERFGDEWAAEARQKGAS